MIAVLLRIYIVLKQNSQTLAVGSIFTDLWVMFTSVKPSGDHVVEWKVYGLFRVIIWGKLCFASVG